MKDAIECLIAQGAAEQAQAGLPERAVLAPDTHSIHDVEKYLDKRTRYRAGITTHSMDDFGAISLEDVSGAKGEACFIDAEGMSAKTVFNLGTLEDPSHGDHWALLNLRRTAEFTEILKINGSRMTQQQAAEWLEDWREFITPIWTGDEDPRHNIQSAINTVRNVKVESSRSTDHSVSNFGAERSDLEKIEARGRELPLPSHFDFICRPYEHLGERKVSLRLSFSTGDAPRFTFRIVREEHFQSLIAEEFKESVIGVLDGFSGRIVLGSLSLN